MDLGTAVVIGNGESRSSIDLNTLEGTLIGCNAVHRDVTVPFLVCCDKRMVYEAQTNPKNANTIIYTRVDWYNEFYGVKPFPGLPYQGTTRADNIWHWGSGPLAVFLAAEMGFETVKIIGFDLVGIGHKVNNIYKGTKNYAGAESAAVDPSYWEYQIAKVFEIYANTKFVILNKPDWIMPTSWKKNNVSRVDL